MDEHIEKQKQSDEIDIFEFCSRIWTAFVDFLSKVGHFITSVIVFLIRKSIWIAGFTIIGMLVGYLLYNKTDRYYASLLEGHTGDVDNIVVIDHINKLNRLTPTKNRLLARYLNLPDEDIKKVLKIEAFYGLDVNKDGKPDMVDLKKSYNPKDTSITRVPSYVYIKVSVLDEAIFPSLRQGLLYYINSNAYIRDLHKIAREQKEQYIKALANEIGKIDRMQRSMYRKPTKLSESSQTVIVGGDSKKEFYSELLFDLYTRKQRYEKELDLSPNIITVVQDFTPLAEEENPLIYYFIRYGGIMAVIGLVCSLLWQYRKKIWKLIIEPQTK